MHESDGHATRRQVLRWAALGAVGAAVAACGGEQKPHATAADPSLEPSTQASPFPSSSPAATRMPGAPASEITNGSRSSAQVALTFHTNGDLALVRQLLAALKDNGAVATCFIVGNWLEANPSIGRLIKDGGHEWGNHTYDHPDPFATLDADAMLSEITRCRDVLTQVLGSPGRWFRPSATDHANEAILAAAGKAGYDHSVSYDVDPQDFRDPGAQTVVDRTLAAAKPGSIISLHMGHRGTIEALPKLLDGLRSANLAPVTLSTLVGG